MLKQQQGGMLGGWLGRVTGSFSESDEEGTARRGGTTSAPGASPRGWGSGMVTALSGSGRSVGCYAKLSALEVTGCAAENAQHAQPL